MAPVAPAPPTMSRDAATPKPQAKVPDNGCCMQCCGAAPPSIDVNDILVDGGKYIQHEDGRIVEYFVYGSEAPDAKGVMLQINGSMGTGYLPANQSMVNQKLKDLNIRGLAITIPGYGYTSMFPVGYMLGDWTKMDVLPVLKAEGLADKPLWVEGSSYGAGIALGVAHSLGEQVERLHIHVPYIPWELRKELGMPESIGDDAFLDKDTAWANSCGSCYLHCCCSCMFNCCGPSAFDDEHTKTLEDKAPGSRAVTHKDITRATRRGTNTHGLVHNVVGSVISKNWGFDPREIKCRNMKVMVSYNLNDTQCGAKELLPKNPHGEFLADFFTKNALKCVVNVGGSEDAKTNQHPAQQWKAHDGTFLAQLAEM